MYTREYFKVGGELCGIEYTQCNQCKLYWLNNGININICEKSDKITNNQPSMYDKECIHMILCNNCKDKCDVCNIIYFRKYCKKLPEEILILINELI